MDGLDKTIIDLFHVLFNATSEQEREFQDILNSLGNDKKQKLLFLFNNRYNLQGSEVRKLNVGLNLLVNNLNEYRDKGRYDDIIRNM